MFIWAALAAYFAFTDLQISISVVNQYSWWANFLQDFGEIPGLLVLFCSAHIFLARYSSESRFRKIALSIILFFAVSFLSGYLVFVIYSGIAGSNSIFQEYQIAIIFILLVLNFLLNIQIRKLKIPNSLIHFSKTSVLLGMYGYLCFIQPIKHFWGRVRFKDLDAFYSNFSQWFLPNGINGNQSFPSGHAAMGWMILPLLILVVNKSKIMKVSLHIIIIFLGVAVSLSRVVIGAHYASDVLFSSFIVIIVFLAIIKPHRDTFNKVSG